MRGIKKQHLPTKLCEACQRPFTWRKKWARDWQHVRVCSERCRRERARQRRLATKSGPCQ